MLPWLIVYEKFVPTMGPYILYRPGWWILTNVCRIWVHTFYIARLTDSDKCVPNMDPYGTFFVALVVGFWQTCAKYGTINSISPWLTKSDKCVPNLGPYISCHPGWPILTYVQRIWENAFCITLVEGFLLTFAESGPTHYMSPWLKSSDECVSNLSQYTISRWWFLLTN